MTEHNKLPEETTGFLENLVSFLTDDDRPREDVAESLRNSGVDPDAALERFRQIVEPASLFNTGNVVQRVNQPEAIGTVLSARKNPQTNTFQYVVQFALGQRVVPEEGLRLFTVRHTPWEALSEQALSGIEHFICTLTYHRLKNPPARIAHSFATARTHFYPHQFKPLLKFLDNPSKRLLIADDVGLGKTIEAGYILRELDMRQGKLDRVLAVVPARLTRKWRKEMKERFGEVFDIIKGSDILQQADLLRHDRSPDRFRWIISYESVRPEEITAAINETQLPIDLLIVDEAHRLRNPETLQHRLGSALCDCADTVLFLSATPVMTSLENLWHLLRLLSPAEFQEWPVFEQQMRANRLLLSAQHSLAEKPPDLSGALRHFETFVRDHTSEAARQGEFLRSVWDRLRHVASDKEQLRGLQADIGLLSPTGHIICRTRKREALPNSPVRDASWSRVELSPAERAIYDDVEELCRMTWPSMSDFGFQMSLLMAYRITASCIPAAMEYFRDKLQGTPTSSIVSLDEDVEEDDTPESGDLTAWTSRETRERLSSVLSHYQLGAVPDSKLERLKVLLQKIWDDDRQSSRKRRKVVVFSYFRRTVEYLARKLEEAGISNRMIHGGIPVDDRERVIDDFLQMESVSLLLTSEVGGEGIDLQAACVVVNYDLPWNPMVVEQRIGRIDRIGQQSPILYIFNFVVKDSVEERILARLLDRIEVFRQSIGELDDILGSQVEELTKKAISGELSGEQLERVLEQTAEAMGNRVQSAQTMLRQVDGLLAADQALIQEINAVAGERQLPSENELILYLNKFLGGRYPGCLIPDKAVRDAVTADLHGPLGPAIEARADRLGEEAIWFARKITTSDVLMTLSRDVAYRHQRAELIHLQHPLSQFVVSEDSESALETPAFALALRSSRVPPGNYVFLVALLHIFGQRPITKLVPLFTDLEARQTWTDPDETTPWLIELLDSGKDTEPPQLNGQVSHIRERLWQALEEFKGGLETRERKLDQARREQQIASQIATADFRIRRAEETYSGLTHRGARDFAVRMSAFRVEKAKRDKDYLLSSIPTASWQAVEHEEIAVGFLRVLGGGS